ncbi:20976_t:CDS:2, partial [Gigaspora margarita]
MSNYLKINIFEKKSINIFSKHREILTKHAYQFIDEIKRLSSELDTLISQINQLQIFNSEYEAKDIIQLRKIESLQSINKLARNKLALAQKDTLTIQKDLSKKESENLSLKSK